MTIHPNTVRPRIEDVETANQTSRLASSQALTQAEVAVLAQADHLPDVVRQFLGIDDQSN